MMSTLATWDSPNFRLSAVRLRPQPPVGHIDWVGNMQHGTTVNCSKSTMATPNAPNPRRRRRQRVAGRRPHIVFVHLDLGIGGAEQLRIVKGWAKLDPETNKAASALREGASQINQVIGIL